MDDAIKAKREKLLSKLSKEERQGIEEYEERAWAEELYEPLLDYSANPKNKKAEDKFESKLKEVKEKSGFDGLKLLQKYPPYFV